MSETAATRLTALCTALAAVGALVGLLVNSGEPTAAPAVTAAPVVHVVD